MKNMTIVGRVTKDAQVVMRNVGGKETPVCNFNVAVNTRKATAEKNDAGKRVYNDHADFVQVALWREQAQSIAKYLTKGRLVAVTGDFDFVVWTDRDQKLHPTAKFTSPKIELLGANNTESDEPAEDNVVSDTPAADPDELPFG